MTHVEVKLSSSNDASWMDTCIAGMAEGTAQLMELRDVVAFETLKEMGWKALAMTLESPLGQTGTYEYFLTERQSVASYAPERVYRYWNSASNQDALAKYRLYTGPGNLHPQVAVRGLLLERYQGLGPSPDMQETLTNKVAPRLASIARKLETKLGQPMNQGTVGDIVRYIVSVSYLSVARGATLYPIAQRLAHLQMQDVIRHADPSTFGDYLKRMVRSTRVVAKSELSSFIASRVQPDVKMQEQTLFGGNQQAGELWRLAVFLRGVDAQKHWEIIELLVDGKTKQAVGEIEALYHKNEHALPYFISRNLSRNSSWFSALSEAGGIGYV